MAAREDNTATVTLTAIEFNPPTMVWSVEDMFKEFTVFKTPPNIWLETKGVPNNKHYMFFLQLLGTESLHC